MIFYLFDFLRDFKENTANFFIRLLGGYTKKDFNAAVEKRVEKDVKEGVKESVANIILDKKQELMLYTNDISLLIARLYRLSTNALDEERIIHTSKLFLFYDYMYRDNNMTHFSDEIREKFSLAMFHYKDRNNVLKEFDYIERVNDNVAILNALKNHPNVETRPAFIDSILSNPVDVSIAVETLRTPTRTRAGYENIEAFWAHIQEKALLHTNTNLPRLHTSLSLLGDTNNKIRNLFNNNSDSPSVPLASPPSSPLSSPPSSPLSSPSPSSSYAVIPKPNSVIFKSISKSNCHNYSNKEFKISTDLIYGKINLDLDLDFFADELYHTFYNMSLNFFDFILDIKDFCIEFTLNSGLSILMISNDFDIDPTIFMAFFGISSFLFKYYKIYQKLGYKIKRFFSKKK